MLVAEDCIPCILKMAIGGLRSSKLDANLMRKALMGIMEKIMSTDDVWEITSAELVERALLFIKNFTGITDPFLETKQKTNATAMALMAHFRNYIKSSRDPLFTSTKLSIIANVIDNMVLDGNSQYHFDKIISDVESLPLDYGTYEKFLDKLSTSKSIVIIGDNSAESLFDMLLIETIKKYFPVEASYIVRHEPTLNDVTLDDALNFGLNQVANVITNGIIGPLPGTILRRCSAEARNLFWNSDMVIVKGGGSFETLSEEKIAMPHVFFLLMCKCKVHMSFFNKPIGEGIIWRRDSYELREHQKQVQRNSL